MSDDSYIAEEALLKSLTRGISDHRFCFLGERVREIIGPNRQFPGSHAIMQAVWSLVAKELAYIHYSQPHPANWSIYLTDRGAEAAEDENLNPDSVPNYLRKIAGDVPDLSEAAKLHLEESLRAFASDCFLASTMMLGVAADAVFYDVALAYTKRLDTESGIKLMELIDKEPFAYIHKLTEFQKRLATAKGHMTSGLQQNLDLNITLSLNCSDWLAMISAIQRAYRYLGKMHFNTSSSSRGWPVGFYGIKGFC
jgi:hypothetical protein